MTARPTTAIAAIVLAAPLAVDQVFASFLIGQALSAGRPRGSH